MTGTQLKQIIAFCKPYYKATGRWHAWNHIHAVRKIACAIADAEFPQADKRIITAAATIHDMGRIIRDEGHAEESGKLAEPFLLAIGLPRQEVDAVLDAVVHHDVKKIDQAKTVEARIVFDADKVEILSAYGFMRVAFWLVEERKMELGEAVNFLWDYCGGFRQKLFSDFAKKTVEKDFELLEKLVGTFNAYERQWRQD